MSNYLIPVYPISQKMSNMRKYNRMPEIDYEFQELRRSALQKAIEIAPYVHETTIGPRKVSIDHHSSTSAIKNLRVTVDVNGSEQKKKMMHVEAWQNELLIETKCGRMSLGKVMLECNLQRKEAADLDLRSMLSNMIAKRDKMKTEFWNQKELEYERRAQEQRYREIEILQEVAAGDELAKLEQKKLDNENLANAKKIRLRMEKQLESAKWFERFNKNHSRLSTLHVDVNNMLSSDKTIPSKNRQKYDSAITVIISSMDNITENLKSGNIKLDDIQKTEVLVVQMNDLKTAIVQDIANIELANKAIQETISVPEIIHSKETGDIANINNNSPEKPKPAPSAPVKVKFFSNQSHNLYIESKLYLENYERSYRNLLEDVSQKKFRFELQKAVNTPLNTISSVSGSHLKDKYDKLYQLLNGERVRLQNDHISVNQHPEGKAFCMNLLARKIVQQGDLTVSSNPEAAFPIASVTIALCARFPELIKLLDAHFYRDCPYLVPMLIPQCEGQSEEDFYKARGYRYNEDGTVEKQDKFIKRMSGIFRLRAAIWVTRMPRSVNAPHPQSLPHAWRWLAAFTNLEPEMEISATLLFDFLSVCGSECFKHYKRQFAKVLQLLMTEYYDKMQKIDEGGPKTRLGVFMQKIAKDGHIPPPYGSLSGTVW